MELSHGEGDVERRATMPLAIHSSRFCLLVVFASTVLLTTMADAQQGKWLRKAPFPEPSEELLGAAAGEAVCLRRSCAWVEAQGAGV
jgi:hypothetical protein